MNWENIITTFLTACVPALISYLAARNKGKADIELLKTHNQAEFDKIKLQHEVEIERLKTQAEIEDKQSLNHEMMKFAPAIFSKMFSSMSPQELLELGRTVSKK
ncbi:hypothetical protein NHG33_06535 [Aerococcaceae bacterium NML130460]|nr:hypothetical protein [Aerococcaceae bacterium NML130460]